MLVDTVTLYIKAGDGGNGAATFLRNGLTARGGPDGGNGGNGGSIYFQGSSNINDLKEFRFKKKIFAQNGIPGKHQKLYGKNAPDLIIEVPDGTTIVDTKSEKRFEIVANGKPLLIARGGKGGRGNFEFRSATNQAPLYAEEGTKGEEKQLHLELKFIADIGLIGFPNAGKSSLLGVLTNAHPKIGNYPFTTLEPSRGMMGKFSIADIPGLIEGASKGKGLGITFLKHIEKTRLILHCIESTQPDPLKSYKTIRTEFGQFNTSLLEKPEIIILTKIDLLSPQELKLLMKKLQKLKLPIMPLSIYDDATINDLKKKLITAMEEPNDQISL